MAKLTRLAPELPSANLDDALTYYERKLGFEAVMRLPENEYAIVERDGLAIHLFTKQATTTTAVGVHIFTSDLDCKPGAQPSRRQSSESRGAIATSESATNSAAN
jgi:catechol 2,3-dioxygenase-like lactoylglutathione lyase family enzyme